MYGYEEYIVECFKNNTNVKILNINGFDYDIDMKWLPRLLEFGNVKSLCLERCIHIGSIDYITQAIRTNKTITSVFINDKLSTFCVKEIFDVLKLNTTINTLDIGFVNLNVRNFLHEFDGR